VRVQQAEHTGPATVTEGVSGEQARSVAVTGTRNFVVKLNSNPEGAVAFLNGELLCQSTPCSKAIPQGTHKLRIVKEMYRDYNAEITVNRNGQEVVAPLTPTFGFLDVKSEPSGIEVSVNGKPAGKTPIAGFRLPEGGAEVALGNDCYYKKVVTVNIVSGQTRSVHQTLQPREGSVDVRAVDSESGDDIIAGVLVNGRSIGETPFLGKVPVCVQELVVKNDEYGENKVALRLSEGQQFTATAKLEKRGSSKDGMVWVDGGSFMMGSSDGFSDQKPLHQVTVSGFYMDKTQVTRAEYERVMGTNPSSLEGCPDCPVDNVSWHDAKTYCEKVGKRLPTEAEWEYAARAGTTTSYYWGNGSPDAYAWHLGNSGFTTHSVGQKQPNAWGLYDMIGNVWEWCSDWYDENYYTNSPSQNPQGAASGTDRVLRGASCYFRSSALRPATRAKSDPDDHHNSLIGFRCVRSR
jgi:formylglycine-generating enzyme required for sulfatase activity